MKEQLSDRKSIAAQARMKSIATLASDASAGTKRKRSDKGKNSVSEARASSTDDDSAVDDFGKNDNDWAVYREIVSSLQAELLGN